jgi:hypothetical protein
MAPRWQFAPGGRDTAGAGESAHQIGDKGTRARRGLARRRPEERGLKRNLSATESFG